MKSLIIVLLLIDILLVLGLVADVIYSGVRGKKGMGKEVEPEETPEETEPVVEKEPEVEPEKVEEVADTNSEEAPVTEAEPEAPVEEVAEAEPVCEEVAEAEPEVVAEAEPVAEETEKVSEVITPVVKADTFAFAKAERPKPVPFSQKILNLDEKVLGYFDVLNNEFKSYRKVTGRISMKGVSYRSNRKLIAKITVRGKTMKLHIALNPADFPEKKYFQKDLSGVKAYKDVPFTVKVKSDRGLKNALTLVESVMAEREITKKKRYTPVDSVAILNEALNK